MANYMGYEAILYYGTAGSTAATQLTNCTDLDYSLDTEKGSTTVRGDSSAPPITYERVTGRTPGLTWKMINNSSDTALTALLAAGIAGTPVALKYCDRSGNTRFDGDCNITFKNGAPLKGEQTFDFTASPNRESRVAVLS
jgi:hypothetical protein